MNESIHQQILALNNRILHCPCSIPSIQANHGCSIQQFQDFNIYPEMIQVGELYGEPIPNYERFFPKVLILGREPIQQLECLDNQEADALSKFAVHLDYQVHAHRITQFSPLSDIPPITSDFYRFLLQTNRTSHDSSHNWQISGFNEFYQNHQTKIWENLFHINLTSLSVMAWDVEVNTNLTMCGCPFRLRGSPPEWTPVSTPQWMRQQCLQRGYLQEVLEIALPDVVFCQGPTVWEFLTDHEFYWNDGLHQFRRDDLFHAEHPYLVRYNIDAHPVLFQLLPHLSHYAPNSNWIQDLLSRGLFTVDDDYGHEKSLLQYIGRILRSHLNM